jgi:hypothetical protein
VENFHPGPLDRIAVQLGEVDLIANDRAIRRDPTGVIVRVERDLNTTAVQ